MRRLSGGNIYVDLSDDVTIPYKPHEQLTFDINKKFYVNEVNKEVKILLKCKDDEGVDDIVLISLQRDLISNNVFKTIVFQDDLPYQLDLSFFDIVILNFKKLQL